MAPLKKPSQSKTLEDAVKFKNEQLLQVLKKTQVIKKYQKNLPNA